MPKLVITEGGQQIVAVLKQQEWGITVELDGTRVLDIANNGDVWVWVCLTHKLDPGRPPLKISGGGLRVWPPED